MAGVILILATGVFGLLVAGSQHLHSIAITSSPATSSRKICDPIVSGVKETRKPLEWWAEEIEDGPEEGEWLCMEGTQVIFRNSTCNGIPDCDDGSDEYARFCPCPDDKFRCGDVCISCLQRCDRVRDCLNGEDEMDCLNHRCPPRHHQCVSDGTCIRLEATCNHTVECPDGSDEKNCEKNYRKCYNAEFTCDNMKCLRPPDVCDGWDDCGDNSDEKDCSEADFVTCKSGKKVHKTWRCNNWPECSEKYFDDDSDELGCDCTEDHYKCSNGRCIFKGNKCDSKCDCFDTCEDEKNCSHVYTKESGVVECLKGKSVQANGRCIDEQFICDGILHAFGPDITESGCYDNETKSCVLSAGQKRGRPMVFNCKDLRCLPTYMLCDGSRDCLYGDDEDNCGENGACGPDEFMCLNSSCIPLTKRCDGNLDCPYGSDERFCVEDGLSTQRLNFPEHEATFEHICKPQELRPCHDDEWRCSTCGECIKRSLRCNSEVDCAYERDEQYCADNTCDDEHFRCDSGHCVPMSARCDAAFDCRDKSDEKHCGSHKCEQGRTKCSSGQCVPTVAWCNGTTECPDQSDESDCKDDEVCSHGMFKCFEGPCLDKKYVCDGNTDCPSSWVDENDCPFQCSNSHYNCSCVDQEINCSYTGIRDFPHVQSKINRYNFAHNRLGEKLHLHPVEGHGDVIYLDMCDNHIVELGNATLAEMKKLWNLVLCNNNIQNIIYGNFKNLNEVINLDLTGNGIINIGTRAFDGLTSLRKLDLSYQKIYNIDGGAFKGLNSLKTLLLHFNRLTFIRPNTFDGLEILETLHLTGNQITYLEPGVFHGLTSLTELKLDLNPLDTVDANVFKPLRNLVNLTTPEFRFCCLRHHATQCLPVVDDFSSCEDLMSDMVLRLFVWVVGFVALIGNTFVIIWRLMYPSGNKKNHSLLFVNLALGDLMMGVYLLMIAGVDIAYRGVYRMHEQKWRSSLLCQAAGFFSTFSSEASVFTLTVITLDRLTMIISDYGVRRVHEGLVKNVMVGVWGFSLFLAALPLMPFPYFDNFYGRSGVCLALHITNEKPSGWEYSVFIFLVLNMLSFTVIAVSYLLIYVRARKKQPFMECGKNKHGKDREMGRRVTYIVGTDAACWLPIIILGIASLSGAQIPRKVFSYVAVFVLPLNAALNPLLYTFFTDPVRKRLRTLRQSFSSWHTRSTHSIAISGVQLATTHRGQVTTELTDIPGPGSDGKVHTKAAICVYTPANAASSQVTHFIHEPPDQDAAESQDKCSSQNGGDAVQLLNRPRVAPDSKTKPACDTEEEAIVPLETLTADRPATHRNSGRHSRRKNTADRRYD
ncbi:G-protein coupled receptor GRL101-like isoform X2 [Eriocheir sinensis]|uniref:G-protein coupled receptor GRL101-like isoform X2 n=1 Tax=Eriocheir sinensis TaxID=95602 RepID=UPI0021C63C01|nr:G-protein coupled receptor GRL101-like isoform X2 [Eriocheir sinensis]